jgi:hypothetical protein
VDKKTAKFDLNAARWRRSTFAEDGDAGGVEIALLDGGFVAMRHPQYSDVAPLVFTPGEWAAFLAGVNDREFDLPGTAGQESG